MNWEQYSTRDMLNALADGQLDAEQSRYVLSLLEKDNELQKELCEIQRIKHLVSSAYPLEPAVKSTRNASAVWLRAAVYLFALSATFAGGIASSHYFENWQKGEGQTLAGAKVLDNRFIVFVDSHEPVRLEKALNKAETLAQKVEKTGGGVYVVASAEGLDLLRLGATRHEGRILQMSDSYPHLKFVACSNTLYSYKQRGELVELVDNTEVAPSAVEFVVQHMRDGWRYIAI